MYPTLLLGFGNALHTVYAALVLEPGVNPLAFDHRDDFFQASRRGFRAGHYIHLPALQFGEAGVHAEYFGHEQRRFVAAGPGPDFQDDVFLVVWIFWEQHDLQFLLDCGDPGFELRQLILRVGAHLGVGFFRQERFAALNALLQLFVFAEFFDDWHQVAMGFGGLFVFRRILVDIRRDQSLRA